MFETIIRSFPCLNPPKWSWKKYLAPKSTEKPHFHCVHAHARGTWSSYQGPNRPSHLQGCARGLPEGSGEYVLVNWEGEIHHHNLENLTLSWPENRWFWANLEVLEACQVYAKVVLERSSKSTKYELQGSHGDPLYEHFRFGSFWKFNTLPDVCFVPMYEQRWHKH